MYIYLFVLLNKSHGDTIQITLTILGDLAATLLAGSKHTNLLQGLQDLAVHRRRSIDVVRGARATVHTATVHLAKSTHTNSLADVNVTRNRSYTYGRNTETKHERKSKREKQPEPDVSNLLPRLVYLSIRTSTDKVPVRVIGSKLLEGASLDQINPLGHLQLAGTLQVSSVRLDELYRIVINVSCSRGQSPSYPNRIHIRVAYTSHTSNFIPSIPSFTPLFIPSSHAAVKPTITAQITSSRKYTCVTV